MIFDSLNMGNATHIAIRWVWHITGGEFDPNIEAIGALWRPMPDIAPVRSIRWGLPG